MSFARRASTSLLLQFKGVGSINLYRKLYIYLIIYILHRLIHESIGPNIISLLTFICLNLQKISFKGFLLVY